MANIASTHRRYLGKMAHVDPNVGRPLDGNEAPHSHHASQVRQLQTKESLPCCNPGSRRQRWTAGDNAPPRHTTAVILHHSGLLEVRPLHRGADPLLRRWTYGRHRSARNHRGRVFSPPLPRLLAIASLQKTRPLRSFAALRPKTVRRPGGVHERSAIAGDRPRR